MDGRMDGWMGAGTEPNLDRKYHVCGWKREALVSAGAGERHSETWHSRIQRTVIPSKLFQNEAAVLMWCIEEDWGAD
jgi:hypothetical protein